LGVPQSAEFPVNSHITGEQTDPDVAVDASGNILITWGSTGQDGSASGVYAQRYNAVGFPQGTEFRVNSFTTGNQRVPVTAIAPNGLSVIAWTSEGQDGDSNGVYAQRFDVLGNPLGAEFRINAVTSGSQFAEGIAMGADGDFVVTWTAVDGSSVGVVARRFGSTGAPQTDEFRVNTYTTNTQSQSDVALDADGDFVIVWTNESPYGIYGRRFRNPAAAQQVFGTTRIALEAQKNRKRLLDMLAEESGEEAVPI
jgi:hypothetical protein